MPVSAQPGNHSQQLHLQRLCGPSVWDARDLQNRRFVADSVNRFAAQRASGGYAQMRRHSL